MSHFTQIVDPILGHPVGKMRSLPFSLKFEKIRILGDLFHFRHKSIRARVGLRLQSTSSSAVALGLSCTPRHGSEVKYHIPL